MLRLAVFLWNVIRAPGKKNGRRPWRRPAEALGVSRRTLYKRLARYGDRLSRLGPKPPVIRYEPQAHQLVLAPHQAGGPRLGRHG